MIGALSQATSLPIATAVTCPTVRIHPAIIAQAAATASVQLDGKFILGVGSGEALNEHILGDPWPSVGVRLRMMEEAVGVIRLLQEGREVSHHGEFYEVQDARLYTLPENPTPIYVSAFGPQAAEVAGRIGDGLVTAMADTEVIQAFRDAGGAGKPIQAGTKVAWGPDADAALDLAHRLWANEQLPGQLGQTLPRPQDFEAAMSLVDRETVGDAVAHGDDPEVHARQIQQFVDAGIDEVYVHQIGPDMAVFFDAWSRDIRPQVTGL